MLFRSSSSSKLLNLTVSGATTASFTVDKSGNLELNGSVNKVTITAPATAATFTLTDNSTFATVGGYANVMYNNLSRQNLDNPSRNTFGQQRMVPFIYADITDHIKFATEIEIERGGPNAPQTGDGSMQIEFAQLDYLIHEAINLRAGILLMPIGKFNLLHDSPLNDLVDRALGQRPIRLGRRGARPRDARHGRAQQAVGVVEALVDAE